MSNAQRTQIVEETQFLVEVYKSKLSTKKCGLKWRKMYLYTELSTLSTKNGDKSFSEMSIKRTFVLSSTDKNCRFLKKRLTFK